ncbi:MAG: hypothetical protein P8N76_19170 [Pirellulaceae bacterium]|nr:hypothetical protein [Pirellulaceae bacterium]
MSFMTVGQAAAQLSTSEKQVLRLVKGGLLQSTVQDGETLVKRASVLSRKSMLKRRSISNSRPGQSGQGQGQF